MKKRFIIAIIIVAIAGAISVKALAADNMFNKFEEWGKTLKEYVSQEESQTLDASNTVYSITSIKGIDTSSEEIKKEDIYLIGNKSLITKSELELSEKFYEISGSDKAQAKEQAEQYQKQENALYVKALEEGYEVTDKEVNEYLDTLKQTLSEAENNKDVEKIIKAYGSEDEYWNYMFKVYQKDLPIQKYISALEDDYAKQLGMEKTSEEFQKYWDTKFENIKDDLVKEEGYTSVKSNEDNLKKFEVK